MYDDPQRWESMLFNQDTTYHTDYKTGEIKNVVRTVYKPKPEKRRREPSPLKDLQALFPLRSTEITFTMFHRPKPIIQTNPWIKQEPHERPVDDVRLQVQQTRPKVIMDPAVNLDTVEEPMRQKFIDNIYKSTQMKAMDESVDLAPKRINVRAPLLGEYAPANPITIKRVKLPYVSPEWRIPSVTWDTKQERAYTQPTKCFWLERTAKNRQGCE